MNIYMRKKNIRDENIDEEITTNTLVNLVQSLLCGKEQEYKRQLVAKLIKILSTS